MSAVSQPKKQRLSLRNIIPFSQEGRELLTRVSQFVGFVMICSSIVLIPFYNKLKLSPLWWLIVFYFFLSYVAAFTLKLLFLIFYREVWDGFSKCKNKICIFLIYAFIFVVIIGVFSFDGEIIDKHAYALDSLSISYRLTILITTIMGTLLGDAGQDCLKKYTLQKINNSISLTNAHSHATRP